MDPNPIRTQIASHLFKGLNIWKLVQLRSKASARSEAFTWCPVDGRQRSWTYAELYREASAVAAGMQQRGVKQGDKVLLHLENCPEFVITWYACAAIGAVVVSTNTKATDVELRYFIEHSGAIAAVTEPKFVSRVVSCGQQLKWVACACAAEEATGNLWFGDLKGDPDALVAADMPPLAPMCVQYTSGTTALPKAVLWTHANALWGAKTNAAHEGLTPNDCFYCYLPLFHTNALSYTMLASLWVGSRFVLVPKWSTSRFWQISVDNRCTWVNLIMLSFLAMGNLPRPDRHYYKFFGAGACDLEWDTDLGVKSIGWWGMTETITTPIVGDLFLPNRPLSMGRPAPEYQVAVVREDGSPAADEEVGDLLVKGVPGLSLFSEYLHDPEATRNSFNDEGWFKTGDRAALHADGHLSFAGRAKDMLKVGGENVAAVEIEKIVMSVPGVREVAAVGREDPALEEVPVVFVIPTGGASSDLERKIVEACQKSLAEFKVPRSVQILRALPRSTLGKVNKVQLKAAMAGSHDWQSLEAQWLEAELQDPSGDTASS